MQAEQLTKQAIVIQPDPKPHIMERTSTLSMDEKFPADITSVTTPSILISSYKPTTPSDYRHRKEESLHRINKKTQMLQRDWLEEVAKAAKSSLLDQSQTFKGSGRRNLDPMLFDKARARLVSTPISPVHKDTFRATLTNKELV